MDIISGQWVRFWYHPNSGGKHWVHGQFIRLKLVDDNAMQRWVIEVWDGARNGRYRDYNIFQIERGTFDNKAPENFDGVHR